jgi:hypothetical protein
MTRTYFFARRAGDFLAAAFFTATFFTAGDFLAAAFFVTAFFAAGLGAARGL